MAKILLNYRVNYGKDKRPVETYSKSFHRALENRGHEVTAMGEGHEKSIFSVSVDTFDLYIDLDCGRNVEGKLHFQTPESRIPKAVRFIDTHGYPSLHRRLAKEYDHVFFAVWDKRDLFANHNSAHWCPNASDLDWFNYLDHLDVYKSPSNLIGFFGSKGGLDRAKPLLNIAYEHTDYTVDVREIGRTHGHRWPETAKAMANCKFLLNCGQKHDGPNQRVIESMLMHRPLITDRDKRDGMSKLFSEGDHYLGWSGQTELALQIKWCLDNYDLAQSMARRAYQEAVSKHLVKHRVDQILEVCL